MLEDSDNFTQWAGYCADIDCYACSRNPGIVAQTPVEWEDKKVRKYLAVNGITCYERNLIDYVEEVGPKYPDELIDLDVDPAF